MKNIIRHYRYRLASWILGNLGYVSLYGQHILEGENKGHYWPDGIKHM